jgi:hypothetical protein
MTLAESAAPGTLERRWEQSGRSHKSKSGPFASLAAGQKVHVVTAMEVLLSKFSLDAVIDHRRKATE